MLQEKVIQELQGYIDRHLSITLCEKSAPYIEDFNLESISPLELESFINKNRKATLQEVLFKFIDKKAVSDAEIYKKAGIDRRHFSKIRSNPNYRPGTCPRADKKRNRQAAKLCRLLPVRKRDFRPCDSILPREENI